MLHILHIVLHWRLIEN